MGDAMITFGLTGGIACGKSTVTKTFRVNNIPIVDADIVARQVVEPGTFGLSRIIRAFGPRYLNADGTLNRTLLGSVVFADNGARRVLDKIMAPLITTESGTQIAAYHSQGNYIVGYDAALICEMGNSEKFRPLIVVHCPRDTQVERLMSRNNLTRAEAMSRIEAQMPLEKKVKLADYKIDTSGTIEQSVKQTEDIIHILRAKMYQQKLDSGEITYNQVPHPWRDTAGNDPCWECETRPCICEKQND
jgi:dephospho-CoA kinase